MKNHPLDWVRNAQEPAKSYRKMVIGLQNSAYAVSSTVCAFNSEYLKEEKKKMNDTHQIMREIALKKLVISSLFELKPQLDGWYRQLENDGLISEETKNKKKEVRKLFKQVNKFEDIRNQAFHFGDVNEPVDDLLRIYDDIHGSRIVLLNRILEEMINFGFMLRDHAKTKC